MYSHTATSWAEAEVFLSRFIQVLQIEIEDTRLQWSTHYIIILMVVTMLYVQKK